MRNGCKGGARSGEVGLQVDESENVERLRRRRNGMEGRRYIGKSVEVDARVRKDDIEAVQVVEEPAVHLWRAEGTMLMLLLC